MEIRIFKASVYKSSAYNYSMSIAQDGEDGDEVMQDDLQHQNLSLTEAKARAANLHWATGWPIWVQGDE